MRGTKAVTIFVTIIIWLTSVRLVAAYTPTVSDWWFIERYTIDQTERPIGVGIKTTSDAGKNQRTRIFIENHTGVSMYILAHTIPPDRVAEETIIDIPKGFVLLDKIRAGETLTYDAELIQYLASGFIDQNKRAPDRPDDIEIPTSQESQIFVLYGKEILTFPIKVTYELNTDYNPDNGKKPNEFVMTMFMLVVLFVGFIEWLGANPIIPIGILLVIIGLGTIRRRKNQNFES